MCSRYCKILMLFMFFLPPLASHPIAGAQEKAVLFREDFTSLDNWKPLTFPKIAKYTLYTVEHAEGKHFLKAVSDASASAIMYKDAFNVYDYPRVKWRWKINNVYSKGDPRTKEGDDYPIRVFVLFAYDPATAGALQKMQYGLIKQLYGAYPPHSSLSYVWSSMEIPETIMPSPYTDKARMVMLRKGAKEVGAWLDEDVDILDDYQKAFGAKPPGRARIAVMNDSDNTREHAESYIEFIEVYR
jgi:hypothetical protein